MNIFRKFEAGVAAEVAGRVKWFGVSRVIGSVVSVAVVGVAGWWLVRVPPPPPEANLSFASPTVATNSTGGDVNSVGSGVAGTDGASVANGGGAGVASVAIGGGAGVASVAIGGGAGAVAVVTPQIITVHVAGAVENPGVYRLRYGSRVNDGVVAAGGATRTANLDVINLATVLNEGEQIYVPKRGEKPHTITNRPQVGGGSSGGVDGVGGSGGAMNGGAMNGGATNGGAMNGGAMPVININLASVVELEQLPGVGPATAKAIVVYREKNGAFLRVEDLLKVRGIGPAKLSEILLRARVN